MSYLFILVRPSIKQEWRLILVNKKQHFIHSFLNMQTFSSVSSE